MNTILFALLLAASKTRYGQIPHAAEQTLNVLVQSSRLVNECKTDIHGSNCGTVQDLTVVIDGKQYELEGTSNSSSLLRTGTYKAGIVKDKQNNTYEYQRIYEFKFEDGKTHSYKVIREGA